MNEKDFLDNYNVDSYDRPSVTTDTVIFSTNTIETEDKRKKDIQKLEVLLIKRKGHPYKNCWALPGGFLDMNEDLLSSAKREVEEETNISNCYIEQLYTWSSDIDKNGEVIPRDPRTKVVSISHLALLKQEDHSIKAQSDALDVAWFMLDRELIDEYTETTDNVHTGVQVYKYNLHNENDSLDFVIERHITINNSDVTRSYVIKSSNGLAFDHERILDYSLERLANKIDYTPIIFNLMGDKFTLSSLKQVYEVIQNEEISKVAFRRKFKKYVIATGEKETDTQRRPAEFYKYNFNCVDWF